MSNIRIGAPPPDSDPSPARTAAAGEDGRGEISLTAQIERVSSARDGKMQINLIAFVRSDRDLDNARELVTLQLRQCDVTIRVAECRK